MTTHDAMGGKWSCGLGASRLGRRRSAWAGSALTAALFIVICAADPGPRAASEEVATPSALPGPLSSRTDTAAQVRVAAQELERAEAILAKGQGSQRFESAAVAMTAAIDALIPLAEALAPEERRVLARALDGRAQCRLLQSRPEEAESDFALLVVVDPSYALDPAATSSKILDRFRRVRDARIAFVTLQVRTDETTIVWNGRRLGSSLPPEFPVSAGPFVLLARGDCHRSVEIEGSLVAGEKKIIPVRLDPIGRNLRFESSPPGFEVEIDGKLAGSTTAAIAPAPGQPSEVSSGSLVAACVAAGEHTYRLRKECYEEARGTVSVEIDFDDRSPVAIPRVAPLRQEVLLSVFSDVPGATVSVDGAPVGTAPVEGARMCPGRKLVDVRLGPRLVWSGAVEPVKGGPYRVEARARPLLRTIVLEAPGGPSEPAIGPQIAGFIRERILRLTGFNVREQVPGEDGRALLRALVDPAADRPSLRIDLGADLLLAVDVQETDRGRAVRLRLLPVIPGPVETVLCPEDDPLCIERFFAGLDMPWPGAALETGLGLARQGGEGGLLVLSVRAGAKAAGIKEGDRILEAGDDKADSLQSLRSAGQRLLSSPHRETSGGGALPIVVERAGARLELGLPVRWAPVVLSPGRAPVPAARVLATAEFETAVLPPGEARNAALLNLATILIGRGEYARALGLALERGGWKEGIGGAAAPGVARYLAGRCYEALDERDKALAAFRSAAEDGEATFWDPDGLPVAPFARLKLIALSSGH